jgi:hypothetical protein
MHRRVAKWHVVRTTDEGGRAQRQLRTARWLLLVLLVCYGILPLLVFASPPDPVWIPGIYDLADYDDVIVALTDVDAVDDSSPATVPAVHVGERALPRARASVRSNSPLLPYGPRSPPAI